MEDMPGKLLKQHTLQKMSKTSAYYSKSGYKHSTLEKGGKETH